MGYYLPSPQGAIENNRLLFRARGAGRRGVEGSVGPHRAQHSSYLFHNEGEECPCDTHSRLAHADLQRGRGEASDKLLANCWSEGEEDGGSLHPDCFEGSDTGGFHCEDQEYSGRRYRTHSGKNRKKGG